MASVTLTLLPGPDFMMVLTLALTRGAKSAMSFALGLCSGLIFHIAGAALGLGLILKTSPSLYQGIRYFGLVYLLYLGIKSFKKYFENKSEACTVQEVSHKKLYRQGILMNILNPKVTLFFLSFFPQFIGPEASLIEGPLTLGLIFIGQALIVFTLVSLLAGKLNKFMRVEKRATLLIEGLLYFGIAIFLNL